MKASKVIAELEGGRGRSAWDRGVTSYAVGMLEELLMCNRKWSK